MIPAQFLGGITAAGLVYAILPGPLQAENSVGDGVSTGGGFLMEVFLTAELMITILMLAVEKSRTTFIAPLAIGIALTIIHLVGTCLIKVPKVWLRQQGQADRPSMQA